MQAIEGYEGLYSVSDSGAVFSHIKGRIRPLKAVICGDGYTRVGLYSKDRARRRMLAVHRIVASTFVDNPDGKPIVNHKNGVKTDNRASNLEWVSPRENQLHAVATGLHKTAPSFNHLAPEVFRLRQGLVTFAKISSELGISISTAHRLFKLHSNDESS